MNITKHIKIVPLTLAAATLMLVACTQEDNIAASPEIDNSGDRASLSICFSTGSGSTTRVGNAVNGDVDTNYDFNEDNITRLDLFIVYADDNIMHKSIKVKTSKDTGGNIVYSDDNKEGETDYMSKSSSSTTWTIPNVEGANLDGKTLYLVANWEKYDDNITTLAGLQEALTTYNSGASLVPNKKQDSFFMDGKIVASISGDSPNISTDADKKNYTFTEPIKLSRAVAKIRLAVFLESKAGSDPTIGRTLTDITKTSSVAYKLHNYASQGTVVADNSDTYVRSTTSATSSNPLNTFDTELSGDGNDIQTETVTSNTISYNGSSYTLSNYNAAVFYVYPNDWIDPEKCNSDHTLTNIRILDPASLPILEDRRTYFTIEGKYNDDEKYEYTVPVNYQIPTDNDKAVVADYSDLYQLKRNYLYDVIAILDRQGGSSGLYLAYVASDWDVASTYSITDFKATLSKANTDENINLVKDESGEATAIKVAYDENIKSTSDTPSSQYSPKLKLTISGSNISFESKVGNEDWSSKTATGAFASKSYIIHTDNPYFEFLYDGKLVDQISITSAENETSKDVEFQLVPLKAIEENNANRSLSATVYVTVVASGVSGEIAIVKDSSISSVDIPMESNRIVFYQVAPSEYTSSN